MGHGKLTITTIQATIHCRTAILVFEKSREPGIKRTRVKGENEIIIEEKPTYINQSTNQQCITSLNVLISRKRAVLLLLV